MNEPSDETPRQDDETGPSSPKPENSDTTPPEIPRSDQPPRQPIERRVLSDNDAKTLAVIMHILGLCTGFIGPLILWIIKKDEHNLVDVQGKEVLNFQITVIIAGVAIMGIAVASCGVGALLIIPLIIGNLFYSIMGAVESSKGISYRYPLSWRLIE